MFPEAAARWPRPFTGMAKIGALQWLLS